MAYSKAPAGRWRYLNRKTFLLFLSAYTVFGALALTLLDTIPAVVRVPLALPILLFIPGYTILAALFPENVASGLAAETSISSSDEQLHGFTRLERAIVSVVVSIAIVPILALVANALTGIALRPVLLGVTVVTVVTAAIGGFRSASETAADDQTSADGRTAGTTDTEHDWKERLTQPVTIAALLITAGLVVSSVAVLGTGSGAQPARTEFYVVNQTGSSPTQATAGEAFDLRIRHHSDAQQRYTVVAVYERESADGGENDTSRQLQPLSTTVQPDSTAAMTYRISAGSVHTDGRLRFLLYRGEPPDEPDADNAHRVLELGVNTSTE